jgi:hypothetical protein
VLKVFVMSAEQISLTSIRLRYQSTKHIFVIDVAKRPTINVQGIIKGCPRQAKLEGSV